VIVVTMLLGACASATRETPAAAKPTCAPAPPEPVQPSLPPGATDQIGFINSLGITKFSDTYTNTTSPYAGTVIVTETRKRPDFVAAIRKLKGDGDLTVIEKIVPRSLATLRDLADRIMQDRADLVAAGVTVNESGGDPTTDRTEVSVMVDGCAGNTVIPAAMLRKIQGVFDGRYGKGLVLVSPITVSPAGF
jgi:hypothetical protein